MALSGWDNTKKLKLTIDSSKIDSSLTDFPVLVSLSASAGQTGFDSTAVFDELGASYRKIAITDSDDNQLYTEVEDWDNGTEEANLWVKIPAVSASIDTELYLYYDSTHDDNIHYVGKIDDLSYQLVIDYNVEQTYDTSRVIGSWVIKESDTSYKIWYAGRDATTDRIMYATSANGTTWANHQMVVNINQEGTYDDAHVAYACVIKESATSYKMWYSGYSVGTPAWRIMYATSVNGTTWANHQMVININVETVYDTDHAWRPCVIKESASSYKIWYTGHDGTNTRIMYATSANGTTWANHQMVIDIGDEGTYDTNNAGEPSIIKESATSYKIWYGCRSAAETSYRRSMYAESTDGINWSKNQLVLMNNQEGTYDTNFAYYPTVIEDNGSYKMWYTGYDGLRYRILYSPYWSTNVWDGNYSAVYHMNQDPSDGVDAIKDSTPKVNHGTSTGAMLTGDLVDGKIGKALDFDGGDDYINCGSGIGLDDITTITAEATVKASSFGESGFGRILTKSDINNTFGWQLFVANTALLGFFSDYDNTNATWYSGGQTFTLDTWWHTVVKHTRDVGTKANGRIYTNAVNRSLTGTDAIGSTITDAGQDFLIGSRIDGNREFEGIIDEVRISNIYRPEEWIKATYYSNWNDLITFSEAGIFGQFMINNNWKTITAVQVVKDGIWKDVTEMQIMKDGTWKDLTS